MKLSCGIRCCMIRTLANLRCPGCFGVAVHDKPDPEADELGKRFGMAIAYHPEADRKSWDELKGFLKTVFKN